jgi:hypothetical protein
MYVARFSFLTLISLLLFSLSVPSFAGQLTEDEALALYHQIERTPVTKHALGPQERQALLYATSIHPVANLEVLDKYDPTGAIGFCFGRAMTAHLLARKAGLDSASIRKLFVIGDMRQGNEPEWRFHVTTTVKGTDGRWYTIDPIMTPPLADGTPIPVEKWIDVVSATWDLPRPGKRYHVYYYFVDNSVIVPMILDQSSPILQYQSFNPANVPGFAQLNLQGRAAFLVRNDVQSKYFINVNGAEGARFRFADITIGGTIYDYRGYFFDLLQDLAGRPGIRALPRPRLAPGAARPMTAAATLREKRTTGRHNLYSPRFFKN